MDQPPPIDPVNGASAGPNAATPPTSPNQPSPTLPAPQEIEQGLLFAALTYGLGLISIPFFIVPLVMRTNAYALYHAKQMLMLTLTLIAGSIVSFILSFACIGIFVWIGLLVFWIVALVLGLIQVMNRQTKPLPLIGTLAESWFAGITVLRPPGAI